MNLFVTCLDEQFFCHLSMMSCWVTWVFISGVMGLEFAPDRKKLPPRVNVDFTHKKRSHATKEILTRSHRSFPVDNNLHTGAGDPRIG